MLRKILTAIDLTEDSKTVLEAGSKIAKAKNATVYIVYVLEPPNVPFFDELPTEEKEALLNLQKVLKEKAKETLSEYKQKLESEGLCAVPIILQGQVVESVLEFSENNDIDLIIVKSHKKSEIEEKAIGSNSLRIASRSKIPVLVIKEDKTQYDHILVAYDFLPTSEEALKFSLDLASIYNSKVTVIHVDNDSHFTHIKSVYEKVRQHKIEKLQKLKEEYPSIEVVYKEGLPEREILKFSEEKNVDLIVTGKRKDKGGKLSFIGSTSYKILKGAKTAVLVFRSE
ncbi:MAG: universal stress protein [Sulfurihydrogenibium sp.]|nr:universal stress protein [Sulfurihydrogenibium sp.]